MAKPTTPWRKPTLWELGPELGVDLQVPHFDVTDNRFAGGAAGDGVTDDSTAIQAAINAAVLANGSVIFPPPSATYRITKTLNIIPPTGLTQAYCDLRGTPGVEANVGLIFYDGPNNQPAISTRGWRVSSAWNIGIRVPTGKTGVVGWDIDNTGDLVVNNQPPFTISSTQIDFHNCSVFFASGATSGFGWQMGKSGRNSDISCMSWYDCSVNGSDNTANHTGWSAEQPNANAFQWFGGLSLYLNPMINITAQNSECLHVFGMTGTHSVLDYKLASPTPLSVHGGRYEIGAKFLSVAHNTAQPQNIFISGVKIYKYTPPGGIMFDLLGLPNLTLDQVQIVNPSGSDYTTNMIRHYCDGTGQGNTVVRGGVIQAPYPFHTISGGSTGTFRIRCEGVSRVTNTSVYSAMLGADQANALAYSASIATDANLSDYFTIAATNGTAFTIATPTNPFPGRTITYDIKNSSGGAHGVITWGTGFLNGGAGTVGTGAFAGIANTKRRMISFKYDGTNWIEVSRTADI